MKLYYVPVSSYSQKALLALHEKGVPFTPQVVDLTDPSQRAAYEKVYPIGKVPYLVTEDGLGLPEATLIVEYLEETFPAKGTKLMPDDREKRRAVRVRDRFADCYLNEPMQKILFDGMRLEGERDPRGVAQARALLEKAYAMLDHWLAGTAGPYLFGDTFTLADCAATPSLFYLKMCQPFDAHPRIAAYAARLMERPAYQKVMAEAAPILARLNNR